MNPGPAMGRMHSTGFREQAKWKISCVLTNRADLQGKRERRLLQVAVMQIKAEAGVIGPGQRPRKPKYIGQLFS